MTQDSPSRSIINISRHSVLLIALAIVLACFPLAAWYTMSRLAEERATHDAKAMSALISHFRNYYTDNVAGRILEAGNRPITLTERYHEMPAAVPIPATLSIELGELISRDDQAEGIAMAFVSDAPFARRQRPPLDEFQTEALRSFRLDPHLNEFTQQTRVDAYTRNRLATPVRMAPACVACHNAHPDSLIRNWKVGDVRGIQEVSLNVSVGFRPADYAPVLITFLAFVTLSGLLVQEYRKRTMLLQGSQRAAERARDEQEAIFQAAEVGIALLRDRRIVRCNSALAQLFRVPVSALVGQTTQDWYVDQSADPAHADTIYAQLTGGERHHLELTLQRWDGSTFEARLSGGAVDPDDPSQGAVWLVSDITDRKAAEVAMRLGQELAENAAQTKSDFLANMSHEIRTPMNAIIGLSHLALRTDLSPRQLDYLQKIQSSGQHLLGIINEILDFSKIEAGKLDIENTEFQLEKLLDNVANLIGQKAGDKGLELVFDVATDVPAVLVGDALRLGQILVNYANNAIKFTEKGEVRIELRVADRDDGNILLRGAVIDTGVGLTSGQMRKLFQGFQQADTSTTRKFGGTGLGLSISKRLAELMGGQVGVESVPGQGSTFWFTARLGVGSAGKTVRAQLDDLRGRRMLVVDDNDAARAVLHHTLTDMGFTIDEAVTGEDALRILGRQNHDGLPYDAVFLDWQMPGMDGLDTAREILKLKLPSMPKLVLVTTFGQERLRDQASAAGIDDVLIKPVNASLLFDCVVRLLGVVTDQQAGYAAEPPEDIAAKLARVAGARLLLVDDNDLNRQVGSELLMDAGFVVEMAENGQIALDRIAAADPPYDLVLMDMQMPVMDGITATREIRLIYSKEDLPVVAMTANAMQQDRDRCMQSGMQDVVIKPIDPDDLWRALRTWIKPRENAASVAAETPVITSDRIQNEDQAEVMAALQSIAGLDTALGMTRVLGKTPRYLAMLEKFVTGQRSAMTDLRDALAHRDYETAVRIAHTTKGVAGNIGATAVQQSAQTLEEALRNNAPGPDTDALMAHLDSLLTPMMAAIAAQLPKPQEQSSAATRVDEARLRQVLNMLQSLLANTDAAATDLLSEHRSLLQAALPAELMTSLEHAIRDYDFDTAHEQLESYVRSRGRPGTPA